MLEATSRLNEVKFFYKKATKCKDIKEQLNFITATIVLMRTVPLLLASEIKHKNGNEFWDNWFSKYKKKNESFDDYQKRFVDLRNALEKNRVLKAQINFTPEPSIEYLNDGKPVKKVRIHWKFIGGNKLKYKLEDYKSREPISVDNEVVHYFLNEYVNGEKIELSSIIELHIDLWENAIKEIESIL